MHKNISEWALPFSAWELRLYLDTHPNDMRALAAYKQISAGIGHDCYASVRDGSMPVGDSDKCRCDCSDAGEMNAGWTWINGPWPWQLEANKAECED